MRILIDGHMLGGNEGGNERYIKNLAFNLVRAKLLGIKILVPNKYKLTVEDKRFYFIREDMLIRQNSSNIVRNFYLLPKLVKKHNIDILHTTYIAPIVLPSNCKRVITIHDFSYKKYPWFYSLREKIIFNILMPISMRQAEAIIVPSFFSKKELLRFFPSYKSKVFIVKYAPEKIFKKSSLLEKKRKLKEKYNINFPFLLALNNKNPKKNIDRVIEAFILLQSEFHDLRLVVVGGRHNVQTNKEYLKKVIFIEYVSDEDLMYLYNSSEVFIHYSLYEGFGLPLVEAMRCKTACIASDIPVHREVTKNSILYADPLDSNDLAKKIRKILKNRAFKEKVQMTGYHETLDYSWEKTAKKTLEAYEYALKNL